MNTQAAASNRPRVPSEADLKEGFRALGDELREARQEAGLTEDQLFEITRINPEFLRAMESGAFGSLPKSHARYLIKNFSKAVDVAPERILGRYEALCNPPPPPPEPEPAPESEPQARRRKHWWGLGAAGVVLILAAGAWFFYGGDLFGLRPKPVQHAASAPPSNTPAVAPVPLRPVLLGARLLRPAFYPLEGEALTFSVRSEDPIDITVIADGEQAFRGRMTVDSLAWRARRWILVETDAQAAASFSIQQNPLTLPQTDADRHRFEITRTYLWMEDLRMVPEGRPADPAGATPKDATPHDAPAADPPVATG